MFFTERYQQPIFKTFPLEFKDDLDQYKRIFDSLEPHREQLPEKWQNGLDDFQKMLVLRCLRADMLTNSMQVSGR